MKQTLLIIYLFCCHLMAHSQTNNPFPYLTPITHSDDLKVQLFIDKNKSDIFNVKLKELDKNHPLHISTDCESEMTLLAITEIDNSDKKYAIIYGYCPEPEFSIYDANNLDNYIGAIGGLELYIPGNGNLYVSGHVNSNFNLKRKFTFTDNEIKEVKQAHYYVGLKTKTLKPISLYKTKELKNELAKLPANYKIEVILAESSYKPDAYYLIKTEFGLIGWSKVKAGQYKSIDIEGIYWAGD